MTMIVTYLANDYIVQASDRRLIEAVGKKVRVVEDHSNKVLIYSNHLCSPTPGWRGYLLHLQ